MPSAVAWKWHTVTVPEALERARSTPEGLSAAEARARLAHDGPNELPAPARTSFWRILLRQISSVITLLLLAASAVALVSGDGLDAVAIVAVLVINVTLGLVTERSRALWPAVVLHALWNVIMLALSVRNVATPLSLRAPDGALDVIIVLAAMALGSVVLIRVLPAADDRPDQADQDAVLDRKVAA